MTLLKSLILLVLLIGSSAVFAEKKYTEFTNWQLIEMSSKESDSFCVLQNIFDPAALSANERLKTSNLPIIIFMRLIDVKAEVVIVMSTLLWVQDGNTYKTTYKFDDKKILLISAGANEAEFGNTGVYYNYKKYTKVMLKHFKKYNEVSITVDGVDLRPISLKGFSKAFKKFEECSSNTSKLNKVDPFE